MTEQSGSVLDRRLRELAESGPTVPVDYDDLAAAARERLPPAAHDYVAGGAGDEDSVRENRLAFRDYRVVPRVLRDVSELDTAVELFGRTWAGPLAPAPIGAHGLFHEEGELATARAAAELGVPVAVSTVSSEPLESIAEAAGGAPKLFQLYWTRDWEVARSVVGRAEAADYDALVLTVDSKLRRWWRKRGPGAAAYPRGRVRPGTFATDPVVKRRVEGRAYGPEEAFAEDPELDWDRSISWEDLDTLREWTDLPIVLKGILHPADARRAVEWGADGLVVSTHGGRQIDGEVGALAQLPEVVEAVDGACPVLLDSGVRGGADLFRALALGADAAFVGRPYVYGLAAGGQRGVYEVLGNCLAEFESVLGLSGRSAVGEIDREAVLRRGGDWG